MSTILELTIARTADAQPPLGALLESPSGVERRSVVLLAHGAGIDILHPWMAGMSSALARRGFAVLRFRYPYMQLATQLGRRRPPDPTNVLEQAHDDALEELRRRFPQRRWLLAGKSLGARMATHIAAKGAHAHGLVLLGYPLHPPGKPERERSEHFATLAQPALFVHGSRDEFGALDELRAALRRYSGRAELEPIEGGDHSFERGAKHPLAATLEQVGETIERWDARTFPD